MNYTDTELDELEKARTAEAVKPVEAEIVEPIAEENQVVVVSNKEVAETTPEAVSLETSFTRKMDEVKENILKQASESDERFKNEVTKNIKEAAVAHTENEKKRADLTGQTITFESEKLETEQKRNIATQEEDKWKHKREKRQYHYDGVKAIMRFVGIEDPMNLFLLYTLTIFILPFYLLNKLWRGSIGAILTGAQDENRSKSVRGFLWTILALLVIIAILIGVYFFLKSQGVLPDILNKITGAINDN